MRPSGPKISVKTRHGDPEAEAHVPADAERGGALADAEVGHQAEAEVEVWLVGERPAQRDLQIQAKALPVAVEAGSVGERRHQTHVEVPTDTPDGMKPQRGVADRDPQRRSPPGDHLRAVQRRRVTRRPRLLGFRLASEPSQDHRNHRNGDDEPFHRTHAPRRAGYTGYSLTPRMSEARPNQ